MEQGNNNVIIIM